MAGRRHVCLSWRTAVQARRMARELDLPRDMSGDWTLYETSRADLLRFEKRSFMVRNPSVGRTAFHPGVAMFDIKAPPGTPGMAMDPSSMDEHVVTIDLQNCVARGEAALRASVPRRWGLPRRAGLSHGGEGALLDVRVR